MSSTFPIVMQWSDWLQLFLQYLMLSLLSVGGAITTTPDMHRYLVEENRWITDSQFNASIAIAQAAPGPNVLFVALMGWNVGINSGGFLMGLLGVLVTMLGIMIPSTTLTYFASQWGHRNRNLRWVRAFKQGMGPIVIALLVATGWVLTSAHNDPARDWKLWLLTAVAAEVIWRTTLHLLWMLGGGAAVGWLGLVWRTLDCGGRQAKSPRLFSVIPAQVGIHRGELSAPPGGSDIPCYVWVLTAQVARGSTFRNPIQVPSSSSRFSLRVHRRARIKASITLRTVSIAATAITTSKQATATSIH